MGGQAHISSMSRGVASAFLAGEGPGEGLGNFLEKQRLQVRKPVGPSHEDSLCLLLAAPQSRTQTGAQISAQPSGGIDWQTFSLL